VIVFLTTRSAYKSHFRKRIRLLESQISTSDVPPLSIE
jgi:hypothetical protein